MKKIYLKPSMKVVKLQHSGIICTSGRSVKSVSTNLTDDDFEWGGGGDFDAR